MIIVADHITERVRYAFGLLSGLMHLSPVFYTPDQAANVSGPLMVWYAHQEPPAAMRVCHIRPCGLLSQLGLCHTTPDSGTWQHLPVLFPVPDAHLPFDLPAAVFYLVTRYEEYLPFRPDLYGRYDYRLSIAAQLHFLHRPIVNEWVALWQQWWTAEHSVQWPSRPLLQHHHSFDVDIAFQYRAQPPAKQAYHLLKALPSGRLPELLAIVRGKNPDPFDVFDSIAELLKEEEQKVHWFLLLSRRRHPLDKNVRTAHPAYRRLVRRLSASGTPALHPGWEAGTDPQVLQEEINTFRSLTGIFPRQSRFHYLHFVLPHGYRMLLQAGIIEDFSMGYGEINGFRAGISTPFPWYDLLAETTTTLTVHPFGFMDANALFEEKTGPAEALRRLEAMHVACQQAGAGLHTVWHNHFIARNPAGGPWWELYRQYVRNLRTL